MRKHLCLLSVAGLLAACQSEELAEATRGDVQRVRMEVADYVWADETRTSAELSGNSVQFKWTAGDVIGIFGEVGDQVSFPISKGFDSPTAEFDGGVWALRSGCKYVAYHPYSYDNRDRTAIPVSYEGQTQAGNGTVAHLTERDVLVSELTAPAGGEVTFHFDHLGGVARCDGGNRDHAASYGLYCTSTPYSSDYGYSLRFYSGNFYWGYDGRYLGFSVRPLSELPL